MSMLRTCLAGLALGLGGALAFAQSVPAPFIGKWKVEWQTDRQTWAAEMEVTESGGSWQTATSNRSNPCWGRKVPLQHDRVTADSLDLTLKFSDIIPDCKNATVKLKLDDKGGVTGRRSGIEMQMKRE
jgi:hypothetical protein